MSEYTEQAEKFLADTGTTLDVTYLYTGQYWDDDKESRDIYQFTLKNKRGIYSAKFGDSLRNTALREAKKNVSFGWGPLTPKQAKILGSRTVDPSPVLKKEIKSHSKPDAYAILSCLDTYDGSFSSFCNDFGYDTDSRKDEKVYFAVQEQTNGLNKLFTKEQLDMLSEIQ